jgi:hypothetical protein
MAREYYDLLTFPLNSGGVDTPMRLALVASKLGYSHIGLYRPARGQLPDDPGVEVLSVADDGTKAARRADLRIARGRRSRGAVSSEAIDFIIPDPKDRVTIRFAGINDVPIAYTYGSLLKEKSIRRSHLLRMWTLVHQDAVKHGCREVLVSGVGDGYLLRDPRDLAALLSSALGLCVEEALDWISVTPSEILDRARERD